MATPKETAANLRARFEELKAEYEAAPEGSEERKRILKEAEELRQELAKEIEQARALLPVLQ